MDRSGMVQIRASFSVGGRVPPIEREPAGNHANSRQAAADRLAAKHSVATFEAPPYQADAETEAALTAWDEGRLPLYLRGPSIDFAAEIPLMVTHIPIPVADLDVGAKGDEFVFTGWVHERYSELLGSLPHCSPGLQFRKARIVEAAPGMEFVDVSDALLIELSATASPRLDGTSFSVGHKAGVRYWADPDWSTAERFTQSQPYARLSFPGTLERL